MKIKTSELTGPALDWAVAKCEGRDMYFEDGDGPWFSDCERHPDNFNTDYGGWEICGPIIEREKLILLPPMEKATLWRVGSAYDYDWMMENEQKGPTPLIAAMRCYIASKLGDEIEIPEELI